MRLIYKITGTIAIIVAVALLALALVLSHDSACEPDRASAAGAATMKAIVYNCYGSTDVLEYKDTARPPIADNEILVKVRAAAANPLDWHYMRGSPYIMRLSSGVGKPQDPKLGVDFAGTVEAIGKGITRFKPGDEVYGGASGAYAQYLSVRDNQAVTHKPANMSFAQAASVPIAGITALQALRDEGQLQAGQKVLINGASGGVGTFAVQIAGALGAQVTGVCSTRNLEMVRSIGADHVIDYKKEDFTLSDKRYDLIIDNVGNHPLRALLNVLEPGGRLVLVGGQKGDWIGPLAGPLKALLLSPFVDQEMVNLMARLDTDDLVTLRELMESGQLTPVIDRQYPLDEVPAAIRYSEEGRARGKIVITVD